MAELAGKLALVTGAARGIGAGIALDLADKGADVAFTYVRSTDQANDLVKQIEAKGRRAFAIKADSADAAAVKQAVAEAAQKLGGLDILVNNAAVLYASSVEEMPLDQIDQIITTNIRGTVLATQAAIPLMRDNGRIISLGSCLAERVAFEALTIYSMSKSALLSFTRGLSRELGSRGITVNLVHPGPTDTDMNPAHGPAAEGMRQHIALGHYGKVEYVAAAVSFLASPAAKHITGSGLSVDGGTNA